VGRVFESPRARSNFSKAGRAPGVIGDDVLILALAGLLARVFPLRRANLGSSARAVGVE
jgi:hypothetical protein